MADLSTTSATEGNAPVLIEDWLPIRELSIESTRERSGMGTKSRPPLAFLHVWWARAPLVAAAGVTLASLLPNWSSEMEVAVPELRDALRRVRSNRPDLGAASQAVSERDLYAAWILWLCGIRGDAVSAEAARLRGVSNADAFGWRSAFKVSPALEDLKVLHAVLVHRWGRLPRVLDPTAGGGSIPYTSLR